MFNTTLSLVVLRSLQSNLKRNTPGLFFKYRSSSCAKYCNRWYCTNNTLDLDIVQKYLNFLMNNSYQETGLPQDQHQRLRNLIDQKNKIELELQNLTKLSCDGDKDMEKLVEEEKQSFLNNMDRIRNKIINILVPKEEKDTNIDVEVQIIPAVGGSEAKLFAEELFNMYLKFVEYKNLEVLYAEIKKDKSDLRSCYILLSGSVALDIFKYEAGVHRVQRVPATEKSGRTHTSTCSIAVLPKPKLSDIFINPSDLIVEKLRSSGPGGQNVNKVETCIKIYHKPSGLCVESQESRYQFENKKLALQKLKILLSDLEQKKVRAEKISLKKEQVGTNDYSDKIRTYNFGQNRVTDHRINFTIHNIPSFLSGGQHLDLMNSNVREIKEKELMLKHIENVLNSNAYKKLDKSKASNS